MLDQGTGPAKALITLPCRRLPGGQAAHRPHMMPLFLVVTAECCHDLDYRLCSAAR